MEILLVRHGRPVAAAHEKVCAKGFQQWINNYNASLVCPKSPPPKTLADDIHDFFVVSSDLPRAIHSAELCTGKKPDLIVGKLNEMDVPCIKLPIKLSSYTWILFNGIMWLLGLNGQVASFASGVFRARAAAKILLSIADDQKKVVVFGHKITNLLIAFYLIKHGWKGKKNGWRYWSSLALTIPEKFDLTPLMPTSLMPTP